MTSQTQLLRVSEVAQLLAVSDRTVRRWIQQGLLRSARLGNHTLRVERREVDRFRAKHDSHQEVSRELEQANL